MIFLTLVYSPDDSLIMTTSIDNIIQCDLESGLVNTYEHSYKPIKMKTTRYNLDATKIICCGNDNTVYEWNNKSKKIIRAYPSKCDIQSAIYNVDCSIILSYGNYYINEIDIKSGNIINYLFTKDCINNVEYSHDGKSFVVSFENGLIKEFYSNSFELKNIVEESSNEVSEVHYNIDDTKILYNSNNYLREIDIKNHTENYTIYGSWSTVCYNYDSTELFYINILNGNIYQYNIECNEIIRIYEGQASCYPTTFAAGNSHNKFCAIYHDYTYENHNDIIKEWNSTTGELLRTLEI